MSEKENEDIVECALKLFRILHGPGTAGSEFEFNGLNPSVRLGWFRLAKAFLYHDDAQACKDWVAKYGHLAGGAFEDCCTENSVHAQELQSILARIKKQE